MISDEKRLEIVELRKKGYTQPQISKELKISIASVSLWCKRFDPEGKYNKIHNFYGLELNKEIIRFYKECGSIKNTVNHFCNLTYPRLRSLLITRGLWEPQKTPLKETKRNKSLNVINWKKRKKIELIDYKGGKCEKCGYNKCVEALEFHHLDPNEKDFGISNNSYSFERMKKEVDKCILVCSNCHREMHYNLKLDV